jgi:hypothetical protein
MSLQEDSIEKEAKKDLLRNTSKNRLNNKSGDVERKRLFVKKKNNTHLTAPPY